MLPGRPEWRGIVTGLALVAFFVLVLATIWPILPGQALLQTLRFHIAACCLIVALVLVALGGRWRGAFLALFAVLSAGQGASIVWMQQQSREPLSGRTAVAEIDLVSFNLLAWNGRGAEIADMLLAAEADVVVLMESAPIYAERARLSQVYPHRVGCDTEDWCHLTILSRTLLQAVEIDSLSEFSPDRFVSVETMIEGQVVTIFGVHLTKPYFDFQAEVEAARLRGRLLEVEGPLLMAGDFNAAPWSYTLTRLARDAGLVQAPWHPPTWPVALGPLGVPIDNVFTRGPALVEDIEAMADSLGSNHRGLQTRISILD